MKVDGFKGAIFDLDGVIVDTAKYHYLSWKRLANELGFDFTEEQNERLKGVSRMRSLEILLEIGGLDVAEEERRTLAAKKNDWYVERIGRMDRSEVLPGAKEYIEQLRDQGIKIALASASKNAPTIISKLNIEYLFDAVVDGNKVSAAKPDSEVFLHAAEELGLAPADCLVFEDAEAGIEAAKRGGMAAVGVGKAENLKDADAVIAGLHELVSN